MVSTETKLKMAPLSLSNSKTIIYSINGCPFAWGGVAICVPTDGQKLEIFLKAIFVSAARAEYVNCFLIYFINIF
jgi:hypothetical protein